MAIQIPNPGTGNGATGDNEFVLWSKVKDNFNNQTHAASRLVGKERYNLVEVTLNGFNGTGLGGFMASPPESRSDLNVALTADSIIAGDYVGMFQGIPDTTSGERYSTLSIRQLSPTSYTEILSNPTGSETHKRATFASSGPGEWTRYWNSSNTTLDGNGALKLSSPVLRVFSDRITGNDDGDAMAATYTKNGVGDYTITGTTGLRTDGWYVVIPNDMNGNPKVAITLDDKDGVITLKTYVRIFDMSTFKFVPDLEQPLDIPEGRWIDLRFNDLPDEPMPQEV